MDVRYRLINRSGKELFCNLTSNDILMLTEVKSHSHKLKNGNVRAGVIENDEYKVIAFTSNKQYVSSS